MPGARCTRSPCALVVAHGSHHESTGTPGIPARNGFNGFLRALPGDEFLFVTVASGLKICLSPVGPTPLRQLDISNGCQDHTTSPYAATFTNPSTGHVLPARILAKALKRRSSCAPVNRSRKPALRTPRAPDAAASTASHPASVTIAIRPSCRGGTAAFLLLIWVRREGNYFCG
jgi:hypothetical protein